MIPVSSFMPLACFHMRLAVSIGWLLLRSKRDIARRQRLREPCVSVPSKLLEGAILRLLVSCAFRDFDVHLQGYPVGVVGCQTGVYDLVHSSDHDLLEKAGRPLGLLLGALDDQLVVEAEDELGTEVLR